MGLELNKFYQSGTQCYFFPCTEQISFTFYLLYFVSGDANSPVFESQASFPRIPLRKRLLEIVCYMVWVLSKYPVAVMECCCQDIVGKRERSAFFDFKVHTLFSPKTQKQQTKGKVKSVHMQCISFVQSQSPEKNTKTEMYLSWLV